MGRAAHTYVVEATLSDFDDLEVLEYANSLIRQQRFPGEIAGAPHEADARLIADLAESIASGDVREALNRLADAVRGDRVLIEAIDLGRRRVR